MFEKIVFLELDRSLDLAINYHYEPSLVWLSILSAIFASYTAFFVSEHIAISKSSKSKIVWSLSGSMMLGMGIWTMHIIAIFAYSLPISVNFDIPKTIASIIPVMLCSYLVLKTTDKQKITSKQLLMRSMTMGGGIGFMHFLGMEAMSMEGIIRYNAKWFVFSLIFANILAWTSLKLKLWASSEVSSGRLLSTKILIASALMGCAIAGMHYAGMSAMYIFPDASQQIQEMTWSPSKLAKIIGVITLWMGVFLIVVIRVSKRLAFFQQIKVSEAKQRIILATVADAIISVDKNGIIQSFNSAAEKIFGYHADEIITQKIDTLLPDKEQNLTPFQNNIASENDLKPSSQLRELKGQHKDGALYTLEANFSPITTPQGNQGYVGTLRNISERKQAEEKILYLAHFDALTSLPNRFRALDHLSQIVRKAQRNDELVAVLYLDLDDFKKVNDTLGHETGDKVLVEAATRLRSVVRKDDVVGRLGGDEFIVLLSGLSDETEVHPIAKNLLSRMTETFRIEGRELMLTMSIGISVFPEGGKNASDLLRNADSAMYYSKKIGRNTYSYFTREMGYEISRRFMLEEQLHGALERGEFTIFYQPKADIISGQIIGAEALLRWHNPAVGDVSPEEFIPIAEATGAIVNIGKFVLQKALSMTSQWNQDHDASFRIAVNLSPRQFHDPDLVNYIDRTLKQFENLAESLELEITEGLLLSGHRYIDDALNSFSNMGISLAMDDFGIGYSSLNYLRKYPFNVLKIDRSFVNDITIDHSDYELVKASIAMAHSLKLKVVAEGVETEEQLDMLKEMGCDHGQGYLFGKPMSVEDMKKLKGGGGKFLTKSDINR